MSHKFASGKFAHGFCERCGFRAKLTDLKSEGRRRNLVCRVCYDQEHPQDGVRCPDVDAVALRRPAPDPALLASRKLT